RALSAGPLKRLAKIEKSHLSSRGPAFYRTTLVIMNAFLCRTKCERPTKALRADLVKTNDANFIKGFEPEKSTNSFRAEVSLEIRISNAEGVIVLISEPDAVVAHDKANN